VEGGVARVVGEGGGTGDAAGGREAVLGDVGVVSGGDDAAGFVGAVAEGEVGWLGVPVLLPEGVWVTGSAEGRGGSSRDR
jgi:hypothetical protein